MREQFYLALPMKPLCRQDCKGLCPHCGTNLNTETCQCQVPVGGPAAGRPQSADHRAKARRCLIRNAAIPRRGAASAAPTTPSPPPLPASARSAASRRPHTACAPTAAITAPARCGPSTKSNQLLRQCASRSTPWAAITRPGVPSTALWRPRGTWASGWISVGRADRIRDELVRHPDAETMDVSVVDAPDVVAMDESAALALRRKPRSSVMVAAGRVKDGHCERPRHGGAHRRCGRRGPRGLRDAGGRGSAGAGAGRADQAGLGGAARRRRHRGMPAGSTWCSSG